jgi:uncharacterized protein (PEP-CTERM system associated)
MALMRSADAVPAGALALVALLAPTTTSAQPTPPSLPGASLVPRVEAPSGTGGATGAATGAVPAAAVPFGRGSLLPGPLDAPAAPPQGGLTLAPAIGASVLATDNLNLRARDRESDVVTTITPEIRLNLDYARLQGGLYYAPQILFYAENTNNNRVDHYFSGQALATLVEDRLFVDVRGAGGIRSLTGGYAPNSPIPVADPQLRAALAAGQAPPLLNEADTIQTATFQVSPYYLHRFGGIGTLRVGYSYQYTIQDRGGTLFAAAPSDLATDTTAHTVYAVGRTGEDFGRLALQPSLSATTYRGSGELDEAYRNTALLEARYALVRNLFLLVEGGWEDQSYRGPDPYRVVGPIGAAGLRLQGPDSVITAKYGYRDGFASWFIDGAVALGVRTRAFARYDERLTTSALRSSDLLSTAELDEYGNFVDSNSGAPIVPSFANSFLPFQTGLFRLRSGRASIAQGWDRDTVTLSLFYEERIPVRGSGVLNQPTEGVSVGLNWFRSLSDRTALSLFAQYGVTDTTGNRSDDVFTFGATLRHDIAAGLAGFLQYRLTNRDDFSGAGRAVQNVVVAGLRQTF